MVEGINLVPELAKAFGELGFTELTEIQKQVMPLIQQGHDVIGQSHTGSGKTAAFGFPILEKITHRQGLQALMLVPTRELCEQVTGEMIKFAKHKKTSVVPIYGGVSINPQFFALKHADIVVATPGRMLDHMERGTINLQKVKILVLDEADKMFEMGFIDDVKRIISQLPKDRQTLLFSATVSNQVQDIVRHFMKDAKKIKVQSYVDEAMLVQQYYQVDSRNKFSLLVHLLKNETQILTLVFCATRRRVDVITRNLSNSGIKAAATHGGLSQSQRKRSLDMFHEKHVNILVASDVAARGLDIKNVTHVVNYDVPKNSKDYIHRIGRTARAGQEGKVITLLSSEDHENFRSVLEDRSLKIVKAELPQFEKVEFSLADKGSFRGGSGGSRFSGRREFPRRSGDSGGRGYRSNSEGGYRGPSRGGYGQSRSSEGSSSSGESAPRGYGGSDSRPSGTSSYRGPRSGGEGARRAPFHKRFSGGGRR